MLKSGVSTVKEIITMICPTTTSKAWPLKLSHKASVTRSIAALKATRTSTNKASLTTRSTGLKAVSSLTTSKAVSPLTAVGEDLAYHPGRTDPSSPKLSLASQPASS